MVDNIDAEILEKAKLLGRDAHEVNEWLIEEANKRGGKAALLEREAMLLELVSALMNKMRIDTCTGYAAINGLAACAIMRVVKQTGIPSITVGSHFLQLLSDSIKILEETEQKK